MIFCSAIDSVALRLMEQPTQFLSTVQVGITAAVSRVREGVGHLVKIEVEVDGLDQLRELLAVGADAVLLDNMSPSLLAEAVQLVDRRMITEASGRITPVTAVPIAEAGVDLISVGWLTHSARVLDIGLDHVR